MALETRKPEFKSGFTWRSALGVVGSALMFIPVSIYASLLIGSGLAGPAVFATTVLMVEIARLFRQPLTKQETLILYYGAGVGGATWGSTFVSLLLYRTYFIHSPFAFIYKINGVPLADLVPSWLAPPYNSPAYNVRSFFQPAFLPAVSYYAVMSALSFVGEIAIDMMIARAFVEVENYPFPYANVDVSFVTFMSDRPKSYVKPFFTAMGVGAAFGILVYLMPSVSHFALIPLPYDDFTWVIQGILPGAVLAFPTPLGSYVGGFIFPYDAALIMFITAVVVDVFQSLFVTTWPNAFPKWSSSYFKGMGLIAINTRSFSTLWFAPQIGFMIGGALMIGIMARKGIVSLFKALISVGKRSTSILGFPSVTTLLLMYLVATLSSVALFHYLIPQVPLWVPLVMSVGFSFVVAVILSATQGMLGFAVPGVPGWSWQAVLYMTPYVGYTGFVAPPIVVGTAAGGFSQTIRSALLTETKPIDLVKLSILTAILGTVIGLVSINYFWGIAPIPSSVYPATIFSYPVSAQTDSLIVTRGLTFTPSIIVYSALIVMAVIGIGELLHRKVGMLWSTFGFLFGLYAGFPTAFSFFLGSAIGYYVMPRFVGGRESWNTYRAPVVAGEALGEGLALFFATILAMLAKSAWLWPW